MRILLAVICGILRAKGGHSVGRTAQQPRAGRIVCLPMAAAFLLQLFAAFAPTAPAQSASSQTGPTAPATKEEQILTSYEGQKIARLEVAGKPGLDEGKVLTALPFRVGDAFAQDKVTGSAGLLAAAGHFDSVRLDVEPAADGVRILYVVEPAVYFGIFQFPGAERFSYARLLQTALYPVQRPFNQGDVDRDRDRLVTFFRQQGYFECLVEPRVSVDEAHAVANVSFETKLGRKAKFGIVVIDGVDLNESARLEQKLKSTVARFRNAAVRPGKAYRSSTLTKATQYLTTSLQKDGFLAAQVKLQGAEYHADTHRADIHFGVDAGVLTHVQISGAHLWSWTKKATLPVYQGVGVDEEAVQEGRQALISHFQSKGYFDVTVDSKLTTSPTGDTVAYTISKMKKHKVTGVHLSGNKQLATPDLWPQIQVTEKGFLKAGKFSDDLVRTSVNNLKAVYQAEGFSDVAVTPSVVKKDGNIDVAFKVVEGPRDIVHSLVIQGADTFPQSQFAPNGTKLAVGQPYSMQKVKSDRAQIVARYLQAGYLNSSFRESARAVSKEDPHHIDVTYRIYEGPKVAAGEVLTLGRTHTQQKLIDQETAAVKTGQPLTESKLLTAGSHLYDQAGVFDWAEVDPKSDITHQTTEDVLVKVHEAKRNEFTYGIGFEVINRGGSLPSGTVALPNLPPVGLPSNFTASQVTFYGPRGSVQYTRNNMRGKGETLSITAFGGRLDQRGAIYYIDPNLRWSHWKATTSVSGERNEENPIFSSQEEIGSLQMQRPIDKDQKDILFLRYSFSKTDLTRILIPALVPDADQHVRLSTLAANVTRDTRDNVLDEHKGVLQTVELDFNTTKLGSSVDFAKLTAQAAFYKQAVHNIVWATSLRIGLAQPFANSRVPLSEAFFTGGGNSLRGFPLDGAGPQRQVQVCSTGSSTDCTFIQVPSGGKELMIFNAEARIPLPLKKGLSIVPFYDGGNVFPNVGFHDFTSLYSNNVGLGLRYGTPVGPIRIDLGRNLNPVDGVKATQYFISIGQAF